VPQVALGQHRYDGGNRLSLLLNDDLHYLQLTSFGSYHYLHSHLLLPYTTLTNLHSESKLEIARPSDFVKIECVLLAPNTPVYKYDIHYKISYSSSRSSSIHCNHHIAGLNDCISFFSLSQF